ncbi:MAG: capsule assembly Wzi family protein [Candidatus Cyclobacteriaceae bacterium M3_2C_046]
MRSVKLYWISGLIFLQNMALAQTLDSPQIKIGTFVTLASNKYQPLWITSNRFGQITDEQVDMSSHIAFSNHHDFNFKKSSDNKKSFHLKYKLDLYNNSSFGQTFFQEAFVSLNHKGWEFRAGRYQEILGQVHPELSSGSLNISGNAIPIPKFSFRTIDYEVVPYTNGWLQFKGLIGHGWLGKERLMKDAFLHEKNFYMRIGKGKFRIYGGVHHFGIWGGRKSPDFELDRSLKGFMNVLLVREANDGSVVPGRLPNRAGLQRGTVDGGFTFEGYNKTFHLYTQMPVATGTSITIRNIDRLLGFSVDNKDKKSFFHGFVAELLYTKQMSDFPTAKEPYYYYANGVYVTGWEYLGRIIGNPLVINRTRGSNYFNSIQPPVWDPDENYPIVYNIISNRVISAHFGLSYSPLQNLNCKTIVTMARHYPNFNSKNLFDLYKNQFYSLQELHYSNLQSNFSFTGALGFDAGNLSDNAGLMLGIEYEIPKQFSSKLFR